jgi:hypothetical protein
MAYIASNITAGTISHVVADIKTDFPLNGVKVTPKGVCTVLVGANASAAVTVSITFDSPAKIDGGSATYFVYQTINSGGTGTKVDFLIAPTGILLATTQASVPAWILT